MSMKAKWYTMAASLLGGATLLHWGGCGGGLGGFWDGFFNGWPENRTYSLILDILNEELFG